MDGIDLAREVKMRWPHAGEGHTAARQWVEPKIAADNTVPALDHLAMQVRSTAPQRHQLCGKPSPPRDHAQGTLKNILGK